jgi:hypothetical protein
MNSKLIAGFPNSLYSLLRLDYLIICQGNYCAAKLLALFEAWTESRIDNVEQAEVHNKAAAKEGKTAEQDTGRWLYNSVANLKVRLLGEHGDKAIAAALKHLEDLGFLQTRFNPKYKWDRTKQYLFCTGVIQAAIYGITEEQVKGYIPVPTPEMLDFLHLAKLRNGNSTNAESVLPQDGMESAQLRNDPKSHSKSHPNFSPPIPPKDEVWGERQPLNKTEMHRDTTNHPMEAASLPGTSCNPVGEQPGEDDKTPFVEVEVLETEMEVDRRESSPRHTSPVAHQPATRYKRNQPHLPKNVDGSDRLPWDIPGETRKFDSLFEKWMAHKLIQTTYYKNLPAGELITEVRKHISVGKYNLERRDKLLIEWEAMQAHGDSNEVSNPITAKAALTRAKIARAISSPSTF